MFNLLSQGRISPREAIALAYLSQLLLQTLDGVRYEVGLARGFEGYEDMVRDVVDPPAPELDADSDDSSEISDGGPPELEPSVARR